MPKDHAERLSELAGLSLGMWKIILIWSLAALPLLAREKDATQYGTGLMVNVPYPQSEVAQVVQEVIQSGIIRGTKEYNKDEYITGATAVTSTRVFPQWTEGGQVFYKVRLKALDPRNFKDSSDVGTLAVRYVVQAQGDKNTVLRIDARFLEDFRHVGHASNGSVESAEYKDIHDHLEAVELMKAQTVEAEREKQAQLLRKQSSNTPVEETSSSVTQPAATDSASPEARTVGEPASSSPTAPQTVPQNLEERVHDLRRQVQRLVKAPGAPLQSAPFRSASTLQSLPAGTEVLIVVSTTYWFGVETHEGQHGWILREQLEQIP